MRKGIKYFLITFLMAGLIGGLSIAYSAEIDAQIKQEELYNKALALKEDGNYDAAYEILKKLADKNPDVSKYEISYLDAILDQCLTMKEHNNPAWKTKAKEVGVKIKLLYTKYASNADYYLIWAKYSWIVEAKRETHIFKALDKAFYFRKDNPEAYILQGDIYFERAKNTDAEDSARRTNAEEAKTSYVSALSNANISDKRKAYAFYKLGELEAQIFRNKDAAKANWEKAITLAPDSKISKLAQERLK